MLVSDLHAAADISLIARCLGFDTTFVCVGIIANERSTDIIMRDSEVIEITRQNSEKSYPVFEQDAWQ
jgi:hypothetical protein